MHVAQLGDIPGESCDGNMAGTVGRGLSMQAIKIRVALGPSGERLTYQAHVASIGWMAAVRDPDQAGTTGRGLGLQAITISMTP